MQKVTKIKEQFRRLSNQERNQFLFWLGLSAKTSSEELTSRQVYDCIRKSLARLSGAIILQFEGVTAGDLNHNFNIVVKNLNSGRHLLSFKNDLEYLEKYCATAVGRAVAQDLPLTVENLLKTMSRQHRAIQGELSNGVSY